MSGTYSGCEGTIIYTYTYTDCELNTHNWSFTYTVEVLDLPIPQMEVRQLPVLRSRCTHFADYLTSNCGITLTPTCSGNASGTYAACEGTSIYTYTYTDCEGNIQMVLYLYCRAGKLYRAPATEVRSLVLLQQLNRPNTAQRKR